MQNYDDPQVLARLAALKTMTMPQLRQEWEKLFAAATPNNSRPFLEQRLAHRIQELAFGGLSKPVIRALDMLADEVEGKKVRKSVISDPRNPIIGTRLIRDWKGAEHTVVVAKDGFDWNGRRYKSLSAIAKSITGTNWNGYRFRTSCEHLRWHGAGSASLRPVKPLAIRTSPLLRDLPRPMSGGLCGLLTSPPTCCTNC